MRGIHVRVKIGLDFFSVACFLSINDLPFDCQYNNCLDSFQTIKMLGTGENLGQDPKPLG